MKLFSGDFKIKLYLSTLKSYSQYNYNLNTLSVLLTTENLTGIFILIIYSGNFKIKLFISLF